NGFPAGDTALPLDVDSLARIQIVGESGPGAVPDSALVQVIGCLARGSDSSWIVTRTTEPMRTRDPERSKPDALDALKSAPFGTGTFRLLDIPPSEHAISAGQRAEVKGFLIRRRNGDRLNVTSVGVTPAGCDR